ncbi:hypothetical protein TRFO_18587 [Tritrichomonas foetus]|uniref:Uncharacterized protein n=1 Tax=Tritrichomonas foetus TaxID=1144522 RepID=A0A1J4KQR5_9EUKA|nr:hypothetical protein TRFO_18587 [Tritrichomonas foetus]|eukprot:OHT11805.1 hypothetical protein TRFO_18587 [Tritrichomonas foetus]
MNDKNTFKGIDYVLNQSMTKKVDGISEIRSLQGQTICLDNRSNTANAVQLKEKRNETKKNRKYKWQSYSTRKFRKQNEQLKKGNFSYEKMDKISKLWEEYASKIKGHEQSVAKMDFHGATITITASPDPSIVGLTGRIIKESYGALIIISEDNKIRQVNKNHTIAEVCLPLTKSDNSEQTESPELQDRYEINFTTMRCRPYLRATKRWKHRTPIELPF